jgi:hypothetical protein
MATEIDPRLLRISIEVSGQLKTYEGLNMVASGSKCANATQNECEVKISNVDSATRDFILTETSPYNKNKTPKKIFVEAGRRSTGAALVFTGDVVTATQTQPPDITLTLKCATGNYSKGDIIARNQPGMRALSAIAAQVAKDLGLSCDFQCKDKQIANYSFTGGALRQVEKLGLLGQVNAFVDDKTLIVKEYNAPLAGKTRVLNLDTGMIGVPEFTDQGIKVKMLFDNQTVLGAGLQVTSKMNPAANGLYVIYKLDFELASRDTPWYYIAEGKRPS